MLRSMLPHNPSGSPWPTTVRRCSSQNSGTQKQTSSGGSDESREAVQELNATANTPMTPALRSRFLHLKALILEEYVRPRRWSIYWRAISKIDYVGTMLESRSPCSPSLAFTRTSTSTTVPESASERLYH